MAQYPPTTEHVGNPEPNAECELAMRLAARLWLAQHGAPASYSVMDAHYLHAYERVLWAEAAELGLVTP